VPKGKFQNDLANIEAEFRLLCCLATHLLQGHCSLSVRPEDLIAFDLTSKRAWTCSSAAFFNGNWNGRFGRA